MPLAAKRDKNRQGDAMKGLKVLILVIGLSGCITMESGVKFDTSAEARLKVSDTTIEQAYAWFGQPSRINHHSTGETGLVYVHLASHGNGLTGHAETQSETLAMEFGADGKLERYSTGSAPTTAR
jgi:hypothetical protein